MFAFEAMSLTCADNLHNISRLLTIESRPYQRLSSRLLKPDALNYARPTHLPSPPLDASAGDEEAAARAAINDKQIQDIRTWQNEIASEISLLDYAIVRMEFTTNSNHTERQRYAKEKTAITAKQQDVRDHIEELRVQLKEAKETLAIRKTYDELTEKITSSKMLKPRDEQAAAHAKLDEEIAELQQEVENSKNTWAERRTQFGRIQDEAEEMLRMIKDEKEEAERKEGMMKDGDDNEDGEGSTTRGGASQVGTPKPDAGGATPIHTSQADDNSQSLKVPQDRLAPLSRGGSTAVSPARSGLEDTEMADSGAQDDDSSGIEEGEEEEDDGPPDEMDES
ncbi:hypothetical protein BU24DRAFT_425822 [Aaosphaeria arxii CBS 175.79]|uniref:Tho complex subunit 7/Mft1p n=1 Tax=Aaosphaeria arxii CBS 175.79 TaxID=1450172 RepID=A0A6A5XGF6_9PLEO|nr:uncharacterized protein BU24DRAFT_425822 [Aaosphaeria arxii CBS 175.79]KAF2012000.1 hypothetical protein BU24DRAFT_425822 [Aaosphaeria arxii CBS 175.79]